MRKFGGEIMATRCSYETNLSHFLLLFSLNAEKKFSISGKYTNVLKRSFFLKARIWHKTVPYEKVEIYVSYFFSENCYSSI